MSRYRVTWEMEYDDCDSLEDAVSQAYGNIAEIARDPTIGANFVTVRDMDAPGTLPMAIEIGVALAFLYNQAQEETAQ